MTLEVEEGEHKCVIISATKGSTINANYEVRRVVRFTSCWVGWCVCEVARLRWALMFCHRKKAVRHVSTAKLPKPL